MEHGILVVKPDGLTMGINETLQEYLTDAKLELVSSYVTRLSFETAKKTFYTSVFDRNIYYDYLCSGKVYIALLKGNYAISKLRDIKYKIRKFYNCEKTMTNLLHTSDTANEYKSQLEVLFPDHNYYDYKLYGDLHVLYKDRSVIPKHLEHRVALIFNDVRSFYNNLRYVSKESLIGIRSKFCYGDIEIPVIGYFAFNKGLFAVFEMVKTNELAEYVQAVHKYDGLTIVDYVPYEIYSREFVLGLKSIGVDGFKLYDDRYTLKQIEFLRYLVQYKNKMLYTGGSYDSGPPLSLTIDEETFFKFRQQLYK